MVNHNDIIDAVESGMNTREELAEEFDLHPNTMGHHLRDLLKEGRLAREKDGYTYLWSVTDRPGLGDGEDAPASDDEYKAPVNRAYNFDGAVPDRGSVPEYVPTNGEKDAIEAIIKNRHDMGTLPRVLISGPTGNGKTTLAEDTAVQEGTPFFEVSMSNAVYEADLLGTTNVVGDETVWEDGPVTRALISSRERPTVLLIDEVNRALPEVANVLMPVLDHRCRVSLTGGRGGEVIEGDPTNLIVFGTINEGREYHGTNDMDAALKRRFEFKYPTNYLGMAYPDREAELVAERTPAHFGLAELMVEGANDVRALADDADSKVQMGVPTAALLSWASAAFAYDQAGIDDPVDAAARDSIVEPFYGTETAAGQKVETLLLAPLGGAPFGEREFKEWAGELGSRLVCKECSWSDYEEDAPDGALDFMECPDCGGVLEWAK